MIVDSATSHHLEETLAHLETFVDGFLILDCDATDQTERICLNQEKLITYKRRQIKDFSRNETGLRQELWQMVEAAEPKWVLTIDPDEMFEDTIREALPNLIYQERFDAIRFPVNHLWGSLNYIRTDGEWNPHKNYELVLFRYLKDRSYNWPSHGIPSLRHPLEVLSYSCRYSHIRLFHLAWIDRAAIRRRITHLISTSPEAHPKLEERHLLPFNPHLSLKKIDDQT